MTTPIGKFRSCMTKFLDKLEEWANHDQMKALDKFKLKYNMGMKVNPRDSLVIFVDTLLPYADHIMKGDDEYFLNDHIEVEEEYHSLSQQLKTWWPALSDNQKNYIKNSFKLLLMLSAMATRNEELRNIINRYRTADNQLVY